ncbi:MAG: tetratricopeptide repeat protein [Candidatus Marinimicrobia bacterium]|jgi:TolA-binding protein|nr:hypothetical protein [Candidatus Neomarinimicrobiota bacterium]MDP6499647.1 tetratricopeptide repeat protein [Candidatus Neomarinimicrobiota bacterium]MDP6725758.1 tetratricopeptide repeat protein [Candidatus Neomarinimicrobiota bacterium]|tara:strand:+ start:27562 stop:28047 length:486 start_codon:yes stop_codon:yes gene_type:complete
MKHIIIWFSIISLIIVGCEGTKTAEEYFNAAEVERNAKNIKVSLENLEKLIEHYPDNALAAQAQYLMGDIYMNDLRDFDNAISSYTKVVENFSGSSREAQAQFMVGYVQANILSDYESAKATYNLFLEKFPDHELAPSVQFEISNLGKNINDIPVLKHIAS